MSSHVFSSFFARSIKVTKAPAGLAAASALTYYARNQTSRKFATNSSGNFLNSKTVSSSRTTIFTSQKSTLTPSNQNNLSGRGTSSSSSSLMDWYEMHLHSNPVKTKMATGGLLWGVGDVVAQLIPKFFYPPSDNVLGNNIEEPSKDSDPNIFSSIDYHRTVRAVVFGSIIHAPTAHVHYNFLESLTVKAGITGLQIPVFKAVMEQFVYWSWFSNTLYHGAMGAMQGFSLNQIYHRIEEVLWETQKAQWAFWIPIQLLNFRFVPVRHQLNVVLLTSVVWTALLSAWYPPKAIEK